MSDTTADSSGKEQEKDDKPGLGCWLLIVLIVGGIIAFFMWIQDLRGIHSEPDRVHDTEFGESGGRQVAYIQNSKLLNDDQYSEHLDSYIYRLDVIDLTGGERISRYGLGDRPTRWLGTNGSVAWLVSTSPEFGLQACDLKSEDRVMTQKEILAVNAGTLKGPLDTFLFDVRSGGVVTRTSDGKYYLIEPGTFAARPFSLDSILPPPAVTAPPAYLYGTRSAVAYRTATLADGTPLEFSPLTGRILRGTSRVPVDPKFIQAGLLYDSREKKPIEPGPAGSVIVLHYEEDDEDADYILTALAADGKMIWKVTEEELGSGENIHGAGLLGNDIVIVTDDDILFLERTSGTVTRSIDL